MTPSYNRKSEKETLYLRHNGHKFTKAPRSRFAGGDFKPPYTAMVKSHCGERLRKRRSKTTSGEYQGDEGKRTIDEASKA